MYFSVLQLHVHKLTYDIAPQRSTKVYYMFDWPKPRYVGTEFYVASHWIGDLPACIFKRSSGGDLFLLLTTLFFSSSLSPL